MKHLVYFLDFCEGGKRLHFRYFLATFRLLFGYKVFYCFGFFVFLFFFFFFLVLFGNYLSSFWYFLVLLDHSWYFLVVFPVSSRCSRFFQYLPVSLEFQCFSLSFSVSSHIFLFLPVFPQFILKTLPQEFGTDCHGLVND